MRPKLGDVKRTPKYVLIFTGCPRCNTPRWVRSTRRASLCIICGGLSRRKPRRPCLRCGAIIHPGSPYHGNYLVRKFCSRQCSNLHHAPIARKLQQARIGPLNHSFKTGKSIRQDGYIKLNGQNALEHRAIMEQHLGRKLTPNETVHHRNHDRSDNRIDNLVVMTNSEHLKHHWKHHREQLLASRHRRTQS